VLSGPDVGRSFEVFPGATLGRAPDRTVAMRDKSISRHHAHFEHADGVWAIVDDGSTNGFVVDGVREQRAFLTDLREFMIGEVLVRLRTQMSEAPAAPVARVAPAAPVVAAAPRAPIAASEELDDIEIEEDITVPSATVMSLPTRPAAPAPIARPPPSAAGARPVTDPGFQAKGQRALQYHKQEARSGLFVTDLEQRPLWVRALVFALVLAIAAALAWGVYRGVLSLREGASSTAPAEEDA